MSDSPPNAELMKAIGAELPTRDALLDMLKICYAQTQGSLMRTQCTDVEWEFHGLGRRQIVCDFDGGESQELERHSWTNTRILARYRDSNTSRQWLLQRLDCCIPCNIAEEIRD